MLKFPLILHAETGGEARLTELTKTAMQKTAVVIFVMTPS